MTTAMQFWLRSVRRTLPRRAPPVQNETVTSYLHRLANANHFSTDDIILYLVPARGEAATRPRHFVVPLHALAELSGIPALHLAYALPELRPQAGNYHARHLDGLTLPAEPNEQRPACRRCVAALPVDVTVWARHDQNVCLLHKLWIGTGVRHPENQVDLADFPEISQAQRHHCNLIRRRGYQRIRYFYDDAAAIIDRETELPSSNSNRWNRLERFARREQTRQLHRAYDHAAFYPEVVALTSVLGSPFWLHMATSREPSNQDRFYQYANCHGLDGREPWRPQTLRNWVREHRSNRTRDDPTGEQQLARDMRFAAGIADANEFTIRPR